MNEQMQTQSLRWAMPSGEPRVLLKHPLPKRSIPFNVFVPWYPSHLLIKKK